MNKEIWKDIPNYEGLYQVSSFGRAKSLKRYIKVGKKLRLVKEKILKPTANTYGYYHITLSKGNEHKIIYIHIIVAQIFIPNLENKPTVNHIDGIKTNNNVSNLEWATYSEQSKHLYRINLKEKPYGELNPMYRKYGKLNKKSKPILQYDLDNNFIKRWDNAYEVQREYGYRQGNINQCCLGNRKTAYKYKWAYE